MKSIDPDKLNDLRRGRIKALLVAPNRGLHGVKSAPPAQPALVFPGSFNPLHAAHREMADIAAELLGAETHYELSIINVDKPPLEAPDVQARIGQFAPSDAVWLTGAATFVEKSQIFSSATFLVGADTIGRIADVRYYAQGEEGRDEAIAEVSRRGCRFLVFGRCVGESFRALRDMTLPQELGAICQEVPESKFRRDVSSTELRGASRGSN